MLNVPRFFVLGKVISYVEFKGCLPLIRVAPAVGFELFTTTSFVHDFHKIYHYIFHGFTMTLKVYYDFFMTLL